MTIHASIMNMHMLPYCLLGGTGDSKKKHVCAGKAVCASGERDKLCLLNWFSAESHTTCRVDKEFACFSVSHCCLIGALWSQ